MPIADVADCGTSAIPVRIAITLIPGSDPVTARDQLAAFDGITAQAPAAYPAPLATLLRAWTDQHRGEDIAASLTRFEAESGPVNQIELATTMSIDRTAMVYLLDELEDQALVERVHGMQDRRGFLIHLTPTGRETQHRAAAALAHAADAPLTPLDLAEARQLVDLLAKVAAHWQEVSASQQHPATSQTGPAARSSQPPTRQRKGRQHTRAPARRPRRPLSTAAQNPAMRRPRLPRSARPGTAASGRPPLGVPRKRPTEPHGP